jgi:general secretion pathway protein K
VRQNHGLEERGVALALVLWLVVLLGVITTSVVTSTRAASSLLLNARTRAAARYAAESGIVAAVAKLEQHLASAPTLAEQAVFFAAVDRELAALGEQSLGNARFAVKATNLSGRLDLNRARPQALVGLLAQFIALGRASAVVDALQDWRDGDGLVRPQGAEEHDYLRAGSRFVPRNEPLTRPDEFRRIMGVTDSLAYLIEPYVTVDGDERIDVNAAPEPVLAALPEIGPSLAQRVISRRSRRVFTSIAEVAMLLKSSGTESFPRLGVTPSRLLLVSRGWLPGHPLTHEVQAVYGVLRQRHLVLLAWRERDL